MKEYLLDFTRALSFFKENLRDTNALSNAVIKIMEKKPGTFHAFLPENMSFEEIHRFSIGGKTSSLRKEVSYKLVQLINSREFLNCIFDDVNSDFDHLNGNDLYHFYGVHHKKEIYYQIPFSADREVVLKCLNYSSAIWHSLCVVFKKEGMLKKETKEISNSHIKSICRNAIFIMIAAYDSESYIYWRNVQGD
jgi:hypothetical protein